MAPLRPELVDRVRSFLLALITAWPEQTRMSDFKAQTALMLAANDGEVAIVQGMLSGGADIDAQDYLGRTALHAAVTAGSLACVEQLMVARPDIHKSTFAESQSVLHTAVRIGDVQIVKALATAFPVLLDATNSRGNTPQAEAQSMLDHYEQYCSMMKRETRRGPATRQALMEIATLLQRPKPASAG